MMFVPTTDALIRAIVDSAFPGRKDRTVKIRTTARLNVSSYWSEGSRDYFAFVQVTDTGAHAWHVPDQGPFDPQIQGARDVDLASVGPNVVCVEHTIFCGKDRGITIHVPAAMMARNLFPVVAGPDLDDDDRRVLEVTRGYKPAFRLAESGLTRDRWEAAKARLIVRGLLNKAGAITTEGKNIVAAIRGY